MNAQRQMIFQENRLPDEFLRIEKIAPLGTQDIIRLTKAEMETIAGAVRDLDAEERVKLMLNPALKFFSVVEDIGHGVERIDFVPSVELPWSDGEAAVTPCVVGCWEHPRRKGETGLGINLVIVEDLKKQRRCTSSFLCYVQNDYSAIDKDTAQPIVRSLREFYLGLQKTFHDRPTIFRQKEERKFVSSPSQAKQAKRKKSRTVHAYRVITIDSSELQKLTQVDPKRVITCPNYGVIGHWRQYKSGKRIWIQPYRKGKARLHDDLYSSKTYQMPREVHSCVN